MFNGTAETAMSIMFMVMGCSGYWDDQASWVVACLADAKQAQGLCEQAQAQARLEIHLRVEDGDDCPSFTVATPFDLNMRVVDGEVRYWTQPVLCVAGAVQGMGLLAGAQELRAAQWQPGRSAASAERGVGQLIRSDFADKLRAAMSVGEGSH